MTQNHSLDVLNAAPEAEFIAALRPVWEDTPGVVEQVAQQRPFATVMALHEALMRAVRNRTEAERVAIVRSFPDLAGKAAQENSLPANSVAEHAGLGLDRLSSEEFATFQRLNAAYRARFGFPFVMCVRRRTRDSVLQQFEKRVHHDAAAELETATVEIGHITLLRLLDRVEGPGLPKVNGHLSTHVLDTYHGRAGSWIRIELFELGRSARKRLLDVTTNAQGRTDTPLLEGAPLRIGTYELVFHLGEYFAAQGISLSDQPFVDVVPIRFGIDTPEGHYHVPLVATPWSYSTYRGG